MKRRTFLKGVVSCVPLLLMPFKFPVVKSTVEIVKTDYELFCDSMFDAIYSSCGVPKKILQMEFSSGYSMSAEMLLNESKHYNFGAIHKN